MDIIPDSAKRRLAAGGLSLGFGVRNSRTVDIATVAKTCDFDWLFIDMEHSSLDVDLASQLAMAALSAGIAPIIRSGSDLSFIMAGARERSALLRSGKIQD